MHISGISIRNFRSLRKVDIVGLPSSVVVLGENNTGKSNLLDALRLVLDLDLSDRQRNLAAEDFHVSCTKALRGDEILVELSLTGFENDARTKAALRDSCVSDDPLTARMSYLFHPAPNAPAESGEYEWRIFGGTDRRTEFTSTRRRELSISVLPALRDAAADLQNPRRSPLTELVGSAGVSDAVLGGIARAIQEANTQLLGEPSISTLNTSIAQQIAAMVGEDHAEQTELGVSSALPEQALRSVRILVENGFPIARTGLGASNVIYLALLLLRLRSRQSEDRLASSILAVEEPEAHLHPHVQRSLFSYIFAHTSSIVTTHSAQIASVARLPSIVLLRKSGNETVVSRAMSPSITEQQQADLERYLDVNRADLLFARGVILVEGISEQYLVPVAANDTAVSLDQLGITVCSVEGTDFVPYARLLHSLQIPYVVLTDGDPDKDGKLVGVARGIAILRSVAPEATDKLFPPGTDIDDASARRLLATNGVFINDTTLEVEYAKVASPAIIAAYDDLVPGALKRTRLREEIEASGQGDRTADHAFVKRIAEDGKGRFAQRASAHIEGGKHPPYIVAALQSLTTRLGA